jgi:hypothetical protein
LIRLLLLLAVVIVVSLWWARLSARRSRDRLALVRATFLAGPGRPPERSPDLKDVALRGATVALRVPRDWAEEYPDEDHASFRDPGSPGRVLRVACEDIAPEGRGARAVLQERAGATATSLQDLVGGHVLLKCADSVREGGEDRVALRWLIAAPGPRHTRLATFTLTVPERAGLDPLTGDVVALLEREIRAARVDGDVGL